jgi:hypothetical protein
VHEAGRQVVLSPTDFDLAQLLEDAAMRARSRGAPEAAAQLAELARGLTPTESGAARIRRTAHAGRYAFESAQMERAQQLLEEAASAAPTGPMRAEALLYLSRVGYHRRIRRPRRPRRGGPRAGDPSLWRAST